MKNNMVLNVKNLGVRIHTPKGTVQPVNGVDLSLEAGAVLGLVGESGCGKTLTCLSLAGLLESKNTSISGVVELNGQVISGRPRDKSRAFLGKDIAFIMQNPMSAFNPLFTIGRHFEETLIVHTGMAPGQAGETAKTFLGRAGLPRPDIVINQYPFQLSGGMLQRVMIAIAVSMQPGVIIADEPTTALDATVRWQIIGQLTRLREEYNTAILLISHDLGVIAQLADQVAVMYCGYIVEKAPVLELFDNPAHPYTRALMASRPDMKIKRLKPVSGQPPSLLDIDRGCPFFPRCPNAAGICRTYNMEPVSTDRDHLVRCAAYLRDRGAVLDEPA